MSKKVIFKITDYIEPDLKWEEEECRKLGIEFSYYQMRDASPSELIDTFKDADILLTNMATFDAELMDGLENVKVLLRHGIGYDKVDVDAATRNGIVFANEATASSEDVSEHALMLIFASRRALVTLESPPGLFSKKIDICSNFIQVSLYLPLVDDALGLTLEPLQALGFHKFHLGGYTEIILDVLCNAFFQFLQLSDFV